MALFVFFLVMTVAQVSAQQRMSVQVKKSQLRQSPSFLSKILADVSYGDEMLVHGEQGDWRNVGIVETGQNGWIHASALSSKKIVLRAGADDVEKAASTDELALAGKGFNEQVESEFKAQNPNIDYRWIDQMEAVNMSENEIERFLKEGQLAFQETEK